MRRWAAALAVVLAAAGALWVRDRRAAERARPTDTSLPAAALSSSRPAVLPPGVPAPTAVVSGPRNRDPRWGQDDTNADDPVAAYIHTSRYPPSSRPLGPHNDDLLEPNKRHEDTRPSRDGKLRYRFSADRYFVVGDGVLETFLEVDRPVAITTSFVAVLEPGRPFAELTRVPLPLTATSSGMYTAPVRAATLGLTAAADVGVYVAFDSGGSEPEKASFSFHYTPAQAVPARFTGQFRESVRDGSLLIEAGVHVDQAGWYVIDSNLYDRDNHALAWTHYTGSLTAGDTFVPLSFFGKVLRDAAAPAPYSIGQLRGERHVLGRDPDVDRMPGFEGRFATRAWPLDSFSDAEWDDDSRRRRIDRLRDAQAMGPKHPFGQ